MKRPGRTDEFNDDSEGCLNHSIGGAMLVLGLLGGLGYLLYYGATEFLARA